MSVTIRSYQPDDRPHIIALFEEFQDYLISLDPLQPLRRLPGYSQYFLQKTLDDLAAHDGIFNVATDHDAVIGFVAGIIIKPTQGELLECVPSIRGRITELYVHPSYRGQGIGTCLIHEAEKYLLEYGCDVIHVEVFVPNQDAHQFYKKLGYQDRDVDLIKPVWR